MSISSTSLPCQQCLNLLRPRSIRSSPSLRRALSTSTSSRQSEPSPPLSSTSSPKPLSPLLASYKAQQALRLVQLQKLQVQARELLRVARVKSREAVSAWELERKAREMGGKINEATGYGEIERLRKGVASKGSFLFSF